jgi:ferredoxin
MAKIIVKSGNGSQLGRFEADSTQSIASFGALAGVMIPVACNIGVCGLCVAEIESGEQYIDPNAFGMGSFPLLDGQILTCIAGVKSDTPADTEIILTCSNV